MSMQLYTHNEKKKEEKKNTEKFFKQLVISSFDIIEVTLFYQVGKFEAKLKQQISDLMQ